MRGSGLPEGCGAADTVIVTFENEKEKDRGVQGLTSVVLARAEGCAGGSGYRKLPAYRQSRRPPAPTAAIFLFLVLVL